MKRKTIFFGLSTISMLAIGLFTIKASSRFATYYYQESASVCSVAGGFLPPYGGGSCICTALINGKTYTIFTQRSANGTTCLVPATKPC